MLKNSGPLTVNFQFHIKAPQAEKALGEKNPAKQCYK